MTELQYSPKIKPEHLGRKAIVYLRQSSEKQVRQNKESQLLQYDVAKRMRALGWKEVEIIDSDLGSSAAMASARREGFERVLSSVALGEVGIVGSREVSRLKSPKRAVVNCSSDFQSATPGMTWVRLIFIPIDGFSKPFNWYS